MSGRRAVRQQRNYGRTLIKGNAKDPDRVPTGTIRYLDCADDLSILGRGTQGPGLYDSIFENQLQLMTTAGIMNDIVIPIFRFTNLPDIYPDYSILQ